MQKTESKTNRLKKGLSFYAEKLRVETCKLLTFRRQFWKAAKRLTTPNVKFQFVFCKTIVLVSNSNLNIFISGRGRPFFRKFDFCQAIFELGPKCCDALKKRVDHVVWILIGRWNITFWRFNCCELPFSEPLLIHQDYYLMLKKNQK